MTAVPLKPRCAILMTTYNGMPYVEEQLRSIQWQTETDWVLFVSDDGSSDGTFEFLQRAANDDKRILVVKNSSDKHGAYNNFFWCIGTFREKYQDLLELDELPPYYFFADQDDIWEADKLEVMIAELNKLEEEAGPGLPVMCYANRVLVDGDGNALGKTSSALGDGQLVDNPVAGFFFGGYIVGNSQAFNRATLEMASWPEDVLNDAGHDIYFALYAVVYGKFSYIKKPLVRYRRHEHNVSDMRLAPYTPKALLKKIPVNMDWMAHKFWSISVFLYHLPTDTELTLQIKKCIGEGGFKAVRWCHKNRVWQGRSFLSTANLLVTLLSKSYLRSSWFTEERHVAAIGKPAGVIAR